jgi:acyl carrier protein
VPSKPSAPSVETSVCGSPPRKSESGESIAQEVEDTLRAQPSVKAAWVARPQDDDTSVTAYVLCDGTAPPNVPALEQLTVRGASVGSLRVRVVVLTEGSETPTGRRWMWSARLQQRKMASLATHSSLVQLLIGIWTQVLEVPSITPDVNFFDLGGQSIQAMQVVARIEEMLGVELSWISVFETLTIRALADAVAARDVQAGQSETLARLWLATVVPEGSR